MLSTGLCGLWPVAPASAQDQDLDLIPKAAQSAPAQEGSNAQVTSKRESADAAGRLYLENALSVSSLRNDALVPAPSPRPFDWQERLFLDIRRQWRPADRLTFNYSGRVNFRAENDLSFPTHENLINDLREASLGWQPMEQTYLDIGRVNLKSGVALGYNPTDFFRTRAVVEPLSADPTALREDRLGTLLVRGQQFWQRGSLALVFAPRVDRASRIYANTDLPTLNPMFDRTNAHNRLLVQGSLNLTDSFSPELLAYRDGNQTRLGTNLAAGFGQKVIGYVEWSGGRRSSLIDEALRYGRDTGTLAVASPDLVPVDPRNRFQSELSLGASYTTENRITFNLEYHFNQAGWAHSDWANWFAAGTDAQDRTGLDRGSQDWAGRGAGASAAGGAPGSAGIGELWYLRAYAMDQQQPLSRHSAFLRADWVDAFVPRLELTGFINIDAYDGSALVQLAADYYLSDTWTLGGLVMSNVGRNRSDFGSLPQAANILFKVARYF